MFEKGYTWENLFRAGIISPEQVLPKEALVDIDIVLHLQASLQTLKEEFSQTYTELRLLIARQTNLPSQNVVINSTFRPRVIKKVSYLKDKYILSKIKHFKELSYYINSGSSLYPSKSIVEPIILQVLLEYFEMSREELALNTNGSMDYLINRGFTLQCSSDSPIR